MNTVKLTTPKKLSLSIKLFMKNMGLTNRPRFLKFTDKSETYKPSFCFNNCETESKQSGEKTIFGWTIWEDKKNNFLEAEFHAVIFKNNTLIDITPRIDKEKKILFIPDGKREAIRHDENTWDTWTPFKAIRGHLVEISRPILRRVDPKIKNEHTTFEIQN
jgi:hypothetical protein